MPHNPRSLGLVLLLPLPSLCPWCLRPCPQLILLSLGLPLAFLLPVSPQASPHPPQLRPYLSSGHANLALPTGLPVLPHFGLACLTSLWPCLSHFGLGPPPGPCLRPCLACLASGLACHLTCLTLGLALAMGLALPILLWPRLSPLGPCLAHLTSPWGSGLAHLALASPISPSWPWASLHLPAHQFPLWPCVTTLAGQTRELC